jgi:hypothetical protein
MDESALPVFIGRNTAAERLGCWHYRVESEIGSPDVLVRVSWRDDPAWLLARIDRFLKFQDFPAGVLWTRIAADGFRYSQNSKLTKPESNSRAEQSKFNREV